MPLDLTLLGLRIISGSLLMGFTLIVFLVMWKDYRATIEQLGSGRRTYGYLIPLQDIDGEFIVMGDKQPLYPLTTLGRSNTNTISIADSFASNEHAMIALRDGQWWLEDRKSRNGTTLNEMLITQPIIMTNGDIIGIGSTRFRLELLL